MNKLINLIQKLISECLGCLIMLIIPFICICCALAVVGLAHLAKPTYAATCDGAATSSPCASLTTFDLPADWLPPPDPLNALNVPDCTLAKQVPNAVPATLVQPEIPENMVPDHLPASVFAMASFTVTGPVKTLLLVCSPSGGDCKTDDAQLISVRNAEGVQRCFEIFGDVSDPHQPHVNAHPPVDLSRMIKPGPNTISIAFIDLWPPYHSTSAVYAMVEPAPTPQVREPVGVISQSVKPQPDTRIGDMLLAAAFILVVAWRRRAHAAPTPTRNPMMYGVLWLRLPSKRRGLSLWLRRYPAGATVFDQSGYLTVRPGLLPGILQVRPSASGPEIVLPGSAVIPLTASPRGALGAMGNYQWKSFSGFGWGAHQPWEQALHPARKGGGSRRGRGIRYSPGMEGEPLSVQTQHHLNRKE